MASVLPMDPRSLLAGACALLALGPAVAAAAPADLDPSFDGDGIASVQVGESGGVAELAALPDGSLLAAGTGPSNTAAAVRLRADGTPEASFGTGGVFTSSFGGFASAKSISALPDGTFALGGMWAGGENRGSWLATRHNADGSPMASFGGGDGAATGSYAARDVALYPDGRVLVAGEANHRFTAALLVRLLPDGTPDPSFAGDGVIEAPRFAPPAQNEVFQAVLIEPDGDIVVAGRSHSYEQTRLLIARYKPDGTLDPAFGDGGFVIDDTRNYNVRGLARRPDGRLLVAGDRTGEHWWVGAFDEDGSPDTSFGDGDGSVNAATKTTDDRADGLESLDLAPDGGIVLGGRDATNELTVARLLDDGSPDRSFSSDGITHVDLPGEQSTAAHAITDARGRIVAAGGATGSPSGSWTFVRFLGSSTPPLQQPPTGTGTGATNSGSGSGSSSSSSRGSVGGSASSTSGIPVRIAGRMSGLKVQLIGRRPVRGALRFRVGWAPGSRGRGELKVHAVRRSKRVLVASLRFTISGGTGATLRVPLTVTGRRIFGAVRKDGRTPVRATLTATPAPYL